MTMPLHDVIIRTRGSDPEFPCDLLVDGKQLLIPTGAAVRVDLADDAATHITITLLVGSLRIEPESA